MIELPKSFIHESPEGCEYRLVSFKRNIIAIWIDYKCKFSYNNGCPVSCIWGFYNQNTKLYYAPINSKKQGGQVDIKLTTPYTAMQLKLNSLEYALYSST